MTVTIIDTAAPLTTKPEWLPAVRAKGIKTCSRYLTRLPGRDQYKLLRRAEAEAITAAGMTIIANYEGASITTGFPMRWGGAARGNSWHRAGGNCASWVKLAHYPAA